VANLFDQAVNPKTVHSRAKSARCFGPSSAVFFISAQAMPRLPSFCLAVVREEGDVTAVVSMRRISRNLSYSLVNTGLMVCLMRRPPRYEC